VIWILLFGGLRVTGASQERVTNVLAQAASVHPRVLLLYQITLARPWKFNASPMLSLCPLSSFALFCGSGFAFSKHSFDIYSYFSNLGCSPYLPQALTFVLATTSSCLYGGWGFVSQSFLVLPYSIGTHTIAKLHWHHRNTRVT
jgi:hypothetical protein